MACLYVLIVLFVFAIGTEKYFLHDLCTVTLLKYKHQVGVSEYDVYTSVIFILLLYAI